MPLNITITGSSGYIGSKLAPFLSALGHRVYGIDNRMYNQSYQFSRDHLAEFFNCDFRSSQADTPIRRSDIIIHLAALVGKPVCDKMGIDETFGINATGVQHLVKQLSKQQTFITANSNSAYGSNPEICTEETPMNPLSTYAESKLMGEKFALEHPNSVVFRLATVFGVSPKPRLDLLVNDLVYQAYKTKRLELFEPHVMRNYVHIDDVCKALIYAIDKLGRQEVYNFGMDSANCSKEELVDQIVAQLPKTKVTYKEGEDADRRNYTVSSKKASLCGLEATIGLERGITELIHFYKTTKLKKLTEVVGALSNA